MRISDWISDVCSSDLFLSLPRRLNSWRPVYVERVNIWWTAPSPQRPPSRVRMDLSLSHAAIAFTPIEPDTPSPSRASRKMVRTVSAWKGSISSRFLTLAPRCSAATTRSPLGGSDPFQHQDRKSVVMGKSGSVSVDHGGGRYIKK